MHIPPALLGAMAPIGASALHSMAEASKPLADGFVALLRGASDGRQEAPQGGRAIQSPFVGQTTDLSESSVSDFGNRLRYWLRQAGVAGPIDLKLEVSESQQVHVTASGDNAPRIEELLAGEPQWSNQLLALARQARASLGGMRMPWSHQSVDANQAAFQLFLSDERTTARL